MAKIDVISAKKAGTLFGLFIERLKRTPQQTAYQSYNSETKQWFNTTWDDIATPVSYTHLTLPTICSV